MEESMSMELKAPSVERDYLDEVKDKLAATLFEPGSSCDEILAQREKYSYIVAMDVGGGNCSAAGADMGDCGKDEYSVKKLSLRKLGQYNIWSVIGYGNPPGEEKQKVSIGQAAQNRKYRYSNYKRLPEEANLRELVQPDEATEEGEKAGRKVRELNVDYIRALFDGIMDNNEALKAVPREKILLLVGHPSGEDWAGEEARKNLKEMVREATGVEEVLTMAESNAAILYVLKIWPLLGAADRVLIIDLGAYSADITYIDRENLVHEESSIPLGARAVDENIAERGIRKAGLDRKLVNMGDAMYSVRAAKEMFWPDGVKKLPVYMSTRDGGEAKVTLLPEDFSAAVEKELIELPTLQNPLEDTKDSYTGHLSRFIRETGEAHGIERVDAVVIVGGAARMSPAIDAIKSTVNEIWSVPEDRLWPQVVSDELMEEAVPYGMLYYYFKAMHVLSDIPNLATELKNEAARMIPTMAEKITENLMPHVFDGVMLPCAKKWRDAGENGSLKDLNDAITRELKKREHKDRIIKLSDAAIEEKSSSRTKEFQKIISDFMVRHYGRHAGSARWEMPEDGVCTPLEQLSRAVEDNVRKATQSALLENLGVVLGLIGFPLWMAGLVVYVLGETLVESIEDRGLSEEEKKQRAQERERRKEEKEQEEKKKKYEKKRNALGRRFICSNLEASREDMAKGLEEKLADELREAGGKDGFGVPAIYIQQLGDDICKAVYTG